VFDFNDIWVDVSVVVFRLLVLSYWEFLIF